jgi:hypothetical protein
VVSVLDHDVLLHVLAVGDVFEIEVVDLVAAQDANLLDIREVLVN